MMYTLINESSQALKAIKEIEAAAPAPVGVDIETSHLLPHKGEIRLIQLSLGENKTWIFDLHALDLSALKHPLTVMFRGRRKIAHNACFEAKWFASVGVDFSPPLFCSQLASQLCSAGLPGEFNLAAVARQYLGVELDKSEQKSNWSGHLSSNQVRYAAKDAEILIPLREALVERLKNDGLIRVAQIEFEAIPAFAQMELRGLRLDQERLQLQQLKTECLRSQALQEFSEAALEIWDGPKQLSLFGEPTLPFNPNSPAQILKLFNSAGLNLESVSKETLKQLRNPPKIIEKYLGWKNLETRMQDIEKYLKHIDSFTGRVYSNFLQLGAASGRTSSRNPNVQNLPGGEEFREVVVPEQGKTFICADFSQIQLRVAAKISGDPALRKTYQEEGDVHLKTASSILDKPESEITPADRKKAKAVNFGFLFGQGSNGFRRYAKQSYGVELTTEEATLYRNRFFSLYQGLRNWHKTVDKNMRVFPFIRTPVSGRKRKIPPELRRLSVGANTPVQGLEADIGKRALTLVVEALKGLEAFVVCYAHDEILVECSKDCADQVLDILETNMVKAGEEFLGDIPCKVEGHSGQSWAEAK